MIVFIQGQILYNSESILKIQDNPPFDSRGNLIIFDLGPSNLNILKFYSEGDFKEAWRITAASHSGMKKTYTAEKLGFMRDDGISYISFLAKDMPVSGLPHFIFCILMPGNKFVEDFFNYIPV